MNEKNSKEIILNKALPIFGRLGYQKTTMADIANASKRGRRTIYMYFKNKEEIYAAVVEKEIDRIIEKIKRELFQSSTIEEKLSTFIQLRVNEMIQLTNNYDALKTAFISNYKWVHKIRLKLDAQEKIILHSILNEAKTNADFSIDDIEITAKNISMIIRGVEYTLIKEGNESQAEKHLNNLLNILINGLLARQ
ncbi:MAG: TetR/AcrR family transcriptional regulator [Salinivirgaceae bacterium]|nr:TetR/AcrR family transcriptional regulator [Salinivirgaceae bacterium]